MSFGRNEKKKHGGCRPLQNAAEDPVVRQLAKLMYLVFVMLNKLRLGENITVLACAVHVFPTSVDQSDPWAKCCLSPNLNTRLWISTARKETVEWGILGAAGSPDLLCKVLWCVNFLLSLSISPHCERAVSIMPQVHIKEMGAGWYLQLSLLTEPWATRCRATAGSLFPFTTHTHTCTCTLPLLPPFPPTHSSHSPAKQLDL